MQGIQIFHPGENDVKVSYPKMRPTFYKEGAGPIGMDPLQSAPWSQGECGALAEIALQELVVKN